VRGKCAVQEIDTSALLETLQKQGAVMQYVSSAVTNPSLYFR